MVALLTRWALRIWPCLAKARVATKAAARWRMVITDWVRASSTA